MNIQPPGSRRLIKHPMECFAVSVCSGLREGWKIFHE